jgi:hypothetical protein
MRYLKRGKLAGVLGAAVFFIAIAPIARASSIDLYDFALSTSTGISGDWQDTGSAADPLAIIDPTSTLTAGLAGEPAGAVNCCGDASGGTTPGLATVNYTFTAGAAGNYTVSVYYNFDTSTPYFNEYGAINNAGSAEAGVTGEIVNADNAANNVVLFGTCGTPGCETYGTANGVNQVPGTTSNYFANCTATAANPATCNSDVEFALTFNFTTAVANEQVLINAVSSTANPGGFSLEDIHPVDQNNAAASQVYLTGTYTLEGAGGPGPSGTPEPSTWVLFGGALAVFGAVRGVRRKASA